MIPMDLTAALGLALVAGVETGKTIEHCPTKPQSAVEAEFAEAASKTIKTILQIQGVQDTIGTWRLAWGPSVFVNYEGPKPVDCLADNLMFAAQNDERDMIIVAIAGANGGLQRFRTIYDWHSEDFAVNALTALPHDPPGRVSAGTATGVQNLLAMRAGTDGGTGPTTIEAFLAGAASDQRTLVITGHSLGGALAPALALALHHGDSIGTWKKVYFAPFAAPSTGDADYKQELARVFGTRPPIDGTTYTWNTNHINQLDMVPKAWRDVAAVTKLYGPLHTHLSSGPCVGAAAAGLLSVSPIVLEVSFLFPVKPSTYEPLDGRPFCVRDHQGPSCQNGNDRRPACETYSINAAPPIVITGVTSKTPQLADEIFCEHVVPYIQEFGLPAAAFQGLQDRLPNICKLPLQPE